MLLLDRRLMSSFINKNRFIVLFVFVLALSACAYDIEGQSGATSVSVDQAQEVVSSRLDIDLEADQMLDQDAMVLGVVCSGHKYKMKTSDDLNNRLMAVDRDGVLDNTSKPDVRVIASSSNSTVKCIMETSLSGKCQSKVDLSGEIISKLGKVKPFSITKKIIMPTVACGGATGSLKQASYDAVSDLIVMVRAYDK